MNYRNLDKLNVQSKNLKIDFFQGISIIVHVVKSQICFLNRVKLHCQNMHITLCISAMTWSPKHLFQGAVVNFGSVNAITEITM